MVGAVVPNLEQSGGDSEEDRAEDDAEGAEESDASEDGKQNGGGVGAEVGADEDRVEDVVDGADDGTSPDSEYGGFAPVPGETEVDGDRTPDEKGAKGGDHGAGGEGEGPENDAGHSEDPKGEAGEDALDGGDGETAESCGEDGLAGAFEELAGLVVTQGKDGAQGFEGELAVAEQEEEQEEHDDELGDDADGVSEESGYVASDIGGGAAGCVVDVDGTGEAFDAGGEFGAVGDEAGDFFLVGTSAEGVDGGEGLLADLLCEEKRGNDDGEGNKNERDRSAERATFDLCSEPVVRMPGDDSEDDGSGDGAQEGLENKSAENEDAEREQEESDLLP